MTRLEQLVTQSRALSVNAKRSYLQGVRSFVAHAGAAKRGWTPRAVEAWFSSLEVAPQTANVYLRGVKWAARRYEAMREGRNFAAPIENRREDAPAKQRQVLTIPQVNKLLSTCPVGSKDLVELRDRVVLLLGLNVGLRREEMTVLRPSDINFEGGWGVMVRGKGGSVERVPIDQETFAAIGAIATTLQSTTPLLRRANQPLSGKVAGLTPGAIYQIVQQRAAEAGLKVAPHELRHTFVSHALAAGVPPWRVQKAARHKRMATTINPYAHDPAERGEAESVGEIVARMRRGGE